MPDKDALFADIFRVLKPGGVFAASNWLICHDGEPSPDMKAYIAAEGLSFAMASPARYRAGDGSAPASPMSPCATAIPGIARSRAASWNAEGPALREVVGAVGSAYVDKNIRTWEAMQKVLDSGEHRPTHLRGRKPA